MKVRINEPGWDKFDGYLGSVEFKQGVSVRPLSELEERRLGASMRIETLAGDQVGAASELLTSMDMEMPVGNQTQTQKAPAVEMTAADLGVEFEFVSEDEKTAPAPVAAVEDTPFAPAKVWTHAELSAIADEKGMKGIREIANPMDLKDNSMRELIKKILDKQAGVKGSTIEGPEEAEEKATDGQVS